MQTPTRPNSARSRPESAKSAKQVIAASSTPGPKSPLRRPRSAIGRSMAEHLVAVFDPGAGTPRVDRDRLDASGSPSPRRKALREEFERETEIHHRGEEEKRVEFCVLEGHSQSVRGVCVRGDMVYTGSMDGTVKSWDLSFLLFASGHNAEAPRPVRTLPGNPSGIACLAIVDDCFVCSGGWDSDVRVWDLDDNMRAKAPFRGHSEFVRAVAGSSNLLFSGGPPFPARNQHEVLNTHHETLNNQHSTLNTQP